jgi:hypothetical protein
MNTKPTLSVALAGATLVSLTTFSSAQAAQVTLSNYEIPENLILYDTSGTFDSPNIFFNDQPIPSRFLDRLYWEKNLPTKLVSTFLLTVVLGDEYSMNGKGV